MAAATRTARISTFCEPIRHEQARLPETGSGSAWRQRSAVDAPPLSSVLPDLPALDPCASSRAPAGLVDIGHCDLAHGHPQLSLFNAHYDERCFLPIHVYDTERSRPVAVVLRPGKTPGGVEVRAHLRRLVRHIRKCWPKTRITFRGDGHYARPEAMTWCEKNGADYVFGLPGTQPLSKKVDDKADEVRVERALENKDIVRGYAETRHRAGSWTCERRAVARIEATPLGLDIRFVVTNLECGSPEWIYDSLYCARGQAENLIKLHKTQLSSDRTSCRSAVANQVRLVLHTSAYWLMLTVRDAIPKQCDLAKAEFAALAFYVQTRGSAPPRIDAWTKFGQSRRTRPPLRSGSD